MLRDNYRSAETLDVLIVDDSDEIRKRVISMIREIRRIDTIYHAFDAPSAIHIVAEKNPEIVILDISLLKGSGFDVLKAIRGDISATCIVIMLSNFSSAWYRKKSYELGADFFLNKSNDFDLLHQIIPSITKNFKKNLSGSHPKRKID